MIFLARLNRTWQVVPNCFRNSFQNFSFFMLLCFRTSDNFNCYPKNQHTRKNVIILKHALKKFMINKKMFFLGPSQQPSCPIWDLNICLQIKFPFLCFFLELLKLRELGSQGKDDIFEMRFKK